MGIFTENPTISDGLAQDAAKHAQEEKEREAQEAAKQKAEEEAKRHQDAQEQGMI